MVEILHWSNPTVENAQATWPHQKPKAPFIAHRLLLDQSLLTDEPVEVQGFGIITRRFKGVYEIHLKLVKKTRKITTCNGLDSETRGF